MLYKTIAKKSISYEISVMYLHRSILKKEYFLYKYNKIDII